MTLRLVFTVLFSVVCSTLLAQTPIYYPVFSNGYVSFVTADGKAAPITKQKALYQLSNLILEDESIKTFSLNGLDSFVFENGAIILNQGKSLVPFTYGNYYSVYGDSNKELFHARLNRIGKIAENRIPVSVAKFELFEKQDYAWIYLDLNGNQLFAKEFEFADSYSEGLARVRINQRFGFINKDGNLHISNTFKTALSFSEGLAAVRLDSLMGFINKEGDFVIQPQFERVWSFSESRARFYQNGKIGFVDTLGSIVVEAKWDFASKFSNGFAVVYSDSVAGFIDLNGKLVSTGLEHATAFSGGFSAVKKDGKWGYINTKMEWVQPPIYQLAHPFYKELAVIWLENYPFYINKNFERVHHLMDKKEVDRLIAEEIANKKLDSFKALRMLQ